MVEGTAFEMRRTGHTVPWVQIPPYPPSFWCIINLNEQHGTSSQRTGKVYQGQTPGVLLAWYCVFLDHYYQGGVSHD